MCKKLTAFIETYGGTESIPAKEGLARFTGYSSKVKTNCMVSADSTFLAIAPTGT